jgi:hypothetical protein
MDTEFPVTYKVKELPVLGFTMSNIFSALVNNLQGSIDSVLLPVATEGQPHARQAPVFTGQGWRVWDKGIRDYRPLATRVGNTRFDADPTADRTQLVQNKDGVIALLDDTYGIRDTVVVPEGIISVDWDKGSTFKCVLSQDRKSAFYMIHSRPGMKLDILVINQGTDQVPIWDPLIHWPDATEPGMPVAGAGEAASLLVTLENINGVIYGESQAQAHSAIGIT